MLLHGKDNSPITSFIKCTLTVTSILTVADRCLGTVMSIGPLPYLSAADSPLLADPTLDVVLEDFEDGLLNVPGVIAEPIDNPIFPFEPPFVNDGRGIVVGPGPDTDSVDADDGVIDGWGNDGHAFRSTATILDLSGTYNNGLSFSFEATASGAYPNALGFVWTDGEPGPNATVRVIVREVDVSSSLTTHRFDFPSVRGDDEFDGGTREDTFLGFLSSSGVVSLFISSDFDMLLAADVGEDRQLFFEMDHLQFGYTRIPEPDSVVLLMGCLAISWLTTHRKTIA